MDQTVRWSPLARDDLKDAAAYIAADSSVYADALIDQVLETADGLSQFPRMGHRVPEFSRPDLRELPVQQYRLIYQVRSDGVLILGLIHGARDLPRAWREREPADE